MARSKSFGTIPSASPRTHNGAVAEAISPLFQLRRQSLATLLFEDTFYEKGSSTAKDVAALVKQCSIQEVAQLARECRNEMYLRHMPLFLARELCRHPQIKDQKAGAFIAELLYDIIQRPDEMGEFLALYWKDKKDPLAAGVKRGLGKAFGKFNAYSLAKYNGGKAAIKLRDVLRLTHPTPINKDQSDLWKMVKEDNLPTPDTWEVHLSAAKSDVEKRAVWERLLTEKKLGALAFLRNLRNMTNVNVNPDLINFRFNGKFEKVLPFRFLAAAKHAPHLGPQIEKAMLRSTETLPKLKGKTILLVDVSGSMDHQLSDKSDLGRLEAATALAMLLAEVCEDFQLFTFSESLVEIRNPHNERGFAIHNAIVKSQPHRGTALDLAIRHVNPLTADRLICLTDEQANAVSGNWGYGNRVQDPNFDRAYMVNVANNQHGVGYGKWIHIDGFSERIVDYITAYEALGA